MVISYVFPVSCDLFTRILQGSFPSNMTTNWLSKHTGYWNGKYRMALMHRKDQTVVKIFGIWCSSVLYKGLPSRINAPASWRVPPYLLFSIPNIRRSCGVFYVLRIRWDGPIRQIIANEFSCPELIAFDLNLLFQDHSTVSHHWLKWFDAKALLEPKLTKISDIWYYQGTKTSYHVQKNIVVSCMCMELCNDDMFPSCHIATSN